MNHHLDLRTKIIIMLSVMASMFLVALDQMVITTALGKIVEEFNAYSALGWVVTAYLITMTTTVPIAGKLSDLFGRKIVILSGVAIFTVGSLLGGMSGNIEQLILWRAVQGIGGGIITANAFAIVGDLFAARERGKWQGLIGAVFGIASVIGPLLGGFLTESHNIFGLVTDWRWTLFLNVPIGLLALSVIMIFCPPLKYDTKPHVDYKGAILMIVGLATLVLAIDNTESIFADFMSATGLNIIGLRALMFSAVALMLAAFIYVEHRAKEPVLPLSFFKNRNFIVISTAAILYGAGFLGSILYLTQFNQQVFGASPSESGLMLLPMVAGLSMASIGVGRIVSKIGRYKIFMQGGFALTTVAVIGMLFLNETSSYTYEAFVMFFLGLGMGSSLPLINLAVQNEFDVRNLGVATSSAQLFRSLGSTIGVAIFGALLTSVITSNVTTLSSTEYIKSLSSSPAVSQIGSLDDANTLLLLNTPEMKTRVIDQATQSFANMPSQVSAPIISGIKDQQSAYNQKVIKIFSDGMHQIFVIVAVLMVLATIIVSLLKERELKTTQTITPVEA